MFHLATSINPFVRYSLYALLGIVMVHTASADCVQNIAYSAHEERLCLVQQKYNGECERAQNDTLNTVTSCHLPGTDGVRIAKAQQQSTNSVHGDPADSAYRHTLSKIEERNEVLRQSERRWNAYFLDLLGAMRDDNFDTKDCPLAFEGQSERFTMVSYTSLPVRENLGIYMGTAQNDVTHLYVSPMREKFCYGISSRMQAKSPEKDQENQVYNLSQADLKKLQTSPLDQPSTAGFRGTILVSVCSNEQNCFAEQSTIAKAWQDYQTLTHRISAEEDCKRYAEANNSGEINLQELNNVNCAAKNLAQISKADQDQAQKLSAVLFQLPAHNSPK